MKAQITQITMKSSVQLLTKAKRALRRLSRIALFAVTAASIPVQADILVSSWGYGSVLRYDETTGAYLGDFVAAHAGELQTPVGLVFGPDGNLYVADWTGNRVLRFSGWNGAFLSVLADTNLNHPSGIAFGSDNNAYVCNSDGGFNGDVTVFDGASGTPLRSFGSGMLQDPYGIKFGPDGLLYIADRRAGVLRFNVATGDAGVFLSPTNFPGYPGAFDLAFGTGGDLYVSYGHNSAGQVFRFDVSSGSKLGVFASGHGLWNSVGMVFGRDSKLYVASNNYGNGGTEGLFRFDGATGAFIDATTGGVPGNGGAALQFVVQTPPLVMKIRISEFEISWNSVSNATYRVDYRSSLTTNTWTPLVNCVQAVGAATSVFDKVTAGEPQRFYRVVATDCVP